MIVPLLSYRATGVGPHLPSARDEGTVYAYNELGSLIDLYSRERLRRSTEHFHRHLEYASSGNGREAPIGTARHVLRYVRDVILKNASSLEGMGGMYNQGQQCSRGSEMHCFNRMRVFRWCARFWSR